MANRIELLGHASLRITGKRVIYVDPWKLKGDLPPADVILITHCHHDHCSPVDVAKVRRKGTTIIAPADCAASFVGEVRTVAPGDRQELDGLVIDALPAYNIGKQFHPRENGWVGYIITMDGERIYVAGDTDLIPEMKDLRVDVALLPIGGTYTMNADEAAHAAEVIGAKKAIPIHYGDIVGKRSEAERFTKLCKVETEIIG